MTFLQLIALIRRLPVRDLLAYPDDVTDSEDVRDWVQAVVSSAQVFAEMTNTDFDDDILAAAEGILANDAAWEAVHGLLVDIIGTEAFVLYNDDSYGSIVGEIDLAGVEEAAGVVGISPALILAIVQAIGMLLNWLHDDDE